MDKILKILLLVSFLFSDSTLGLISQLNRCAIKINRQNDVRALCGQLGTTVDGSDVAKMESAIGIDYIPLSGLLVSQQFEEADQLTRDLLIKIAGPVASEKGFVYWTQVKKIPSEDLATIERLWLKYSDGKFGYSVQKQIWNKQNQRFDLFCQKVGWKIEDNGVSRLRKFFGKSEFIYDLEKAPRGHLPLTSALRGTTLLKELFNHPVWETKEFASKKN